MEGGAASITWFQTPRFRHSRRLRSGLAYKSVTARVRAEKELPDERFDAETGAGPPRLLEDSQLHGAAESDRRPAQVVRPLPADEPPPRGARRHRPAVGLHQRLPLLGR